MAHLKLGKTSAKAKRNIMGVSFVAAMILFGVGFCLAGFFGLQSLRVNPEWIRTTGVVTDVTSHRGKRSTLYTPVVSYEVDGKRYELISRSSSSVYPELGGEREVAYHPARPHQGKVIEGVWSYLLFIGFILFGGSMALSVPLLLVRSRKRSNRIRRLMQTGQRLSGVLVEVRKIGKHGNRVLYRAVVSAVDLSGEVRNYESDPLMDAGYLLQERFQNGSFPVGVFVNPENEKEYYVNIDDLPNLTPEMIERSQTISN